MSIGFHLDDIEEAYFKNNNITTNHKPPEHKFTDGEVIRALECCKSGYCIARKCPFYDATEDDDIGACTSRLSSNALDLINRQKAEIERLEAHNNKLINNIDNLIYECDCAKQEAIKEFAERLKEKIRVMDRIIIYGEDIDSLAKEMTEGGNG